ncbi:peptidyl-prolyl cis-trans isomerase B (cyclophilin B) [Catalinimonas alkaloidigena]|uniref:peptidylprolyl isomerase n=2 Tax=Catalinimonas alkaloidigena TaxID=1075417 RepID=A0A1G8ZPE3_9BACT|nr:peptidyl-prolyl cis-trans isomerase B (cyclophilin B) [Catalinimonas alkaloidigena]
MSLLAGLASCGPDGAKSGVTSAMNNSAAPDTAADATTESLKLDDQTAPAFLRRYAKEHPENQVVMKTELGDIKVRLYDDTPIHRANLLWLIENDDFPQCAFYRIIKGYMIQAGNIGFYKTKLGKYKIPAEIKAQHFHRRGALAMAAYEEDSVSLKSSSRDFFIVQGEVYEPRVLEALEKQENLQLSATQREAYTTVGGAPALDGHYTVFGEVMEGMEVVDRIAALKVDDHDWPLEDIEVTLEIVK